MSPIRAADPPLVALNFVAFSWALMTVRGLRLGDSRSSTHKALCAAIWVMPIVAALGTLVVLYPVYVHYLNFLYGGTAIAAIAGAGLDALPDGEESRAPLMRGVRDRVVEVAALVVLTIALGTHFVLQGPQVVGPPTHQDNATLTALCPAEKPVFVWGWAAELYSYYDWQPASRYVTFALLVAETPNRESYRLRFLEEMATRPPSCIVEAIGPTWFLGAGHNQLADEIPASRAWLEECYRKVTVTFEETEDQVSVWALEPDCRASR